MTRKDLKRAIISIAFNVCFALLALFIIGVLHKDVALTTTVLLLLSLVGLLKWQSQVTAVAFFVMAVFGIFIELFGVYFGAWSYAVGGPLGIPPWILVAWGIVTASVYQTTLELKRFGVKD